MKWLVLLIIVCALGLFFGYPLANEDSGGECDALERVTVRIALSADNQKPPAEIVMFGQLFQGLSRGQTARVAVKNKYPNVPVSVGCTMLYWRAIVDPKGFRSNNSLVEFHDSNEH
jgi:hypothetical protein